jgi:hypothetical protein
MPPAGIRTHNLSRPVAEDLRLRPRGHWDWPLGNNGEIKYRILKYWADYGIAKFRAILKKGIGFLTLAIDTKVCSVFLEGGHVIVTHHFIGQYLLDIK